MISIVPFININEDTYSESIGNNSVQQAEEWVKQMMLNKEKMSDEKKRLSVLMFYFVNASSISMTQEEFKKLLGCVSGSVAT